MGKRDSLNSTGVLKRIFTIPVCHLLAATSPGVRPRESRAWWRWQSIRGPARQPKRGPLAPPRERGHSGGVLIVRFRDNCSIIHYPEFIAYGRPRNWFRKSGILEPFAIRKGWQTQLPMLRLRRWATGAEGSESVRKNVMKNIT